jgi:hypothetical protein
VAALLYNANAMVRVAGVQPMGFWGLWCQFVARVVSQPKIPNFEALLKFTKFLNFSQYIKICL